MKFLALLALIFLMGSCLDTETQVKDLREHHIEIDDVDILEESIQSDEDENSIDSPVTEKKAQSDWSYKVTFLSENNWGYQIFEKGKMIINQTSIPSVQGINGFDTQEKAERTAQFILNKIENGVFPPTVNREDLENLNVLRN